MTITYAILSANARPPQVGNGSRKPLTEAILSCTGPAACVSDGMVLTSLTDDFTNVESLEAISYCGSPLYNIWGKPSATGVVSGHKVRFVDVSTGSLTSGGTNLASRNWHMRIVGAGPLANLT